MATPVASNTNDTTKSESDSVSIAENPIPSASPVIPKSANPKVIDAVEKARLEKQATNAQAIVDKNLDAAIYELESEDLEQLEQRVAELEKYLGI